MTPPATLAAPTPRSPSGGQDVELRPTLVVNNAAATGNVGTVTYRFEVSSDSTFPNDPAKTNTQDGVAQGSGTTSWPIPRDLTQGVVYFWRARATNGTITTAFSAVESFKAGGGLCSIILSTTSVSVGASGGSSTITITTSSVCNWVAISNDGFIVLTSPSSGSGNGSLTFSVAANTGAARTGTLTVSGQTVTISQAAGSPSSNNNVVASFQLFDPATQGGATTECRIRSAASAATTCTLRSQLSGRRPGARSVDHLHAAIEFVHAGHDRHRVAVVVGGVYLRRDEDVHRHRSNVVVHRHVREDDRHGRRRLAAVEGHADRHRFGG